MRKTFNPLEWMESPDQHKTTEPPHTEPNSEISETETIIREIEAQQVDIAPNYEQWLNIGFAFAEGFGETGREFFHRTSRFYPGYSTAECDRQFTNCLKAKGHGITLKTFFHHAKQAGINISIPKNNVGKKQVSNETTQKVVPENRQMPNFPNSLFSNLPEFLQKVVQPASSQEEKDLMLLGALVSLSACLPKLYGIYDGRKMHPNLFLFITAKASAGKGRLMLCKHLVNPIHKQMREQAKMLKMQHDSEMADYNTKKGKEENIEKPTKPPEKMLFIPANNSSTGAYQLLGDSDGKGLIFETEGDTLAHAFKSDYGNYSDGFRKAFHHETISYYRRTDREYVDIENPCLSAVLSGTPKQVLSLIPNAENGLFSRFILYYMNVRPTWKNVFATDTNQGLDEYFESLGNEFYELYRVLKTNPEMQFLLTAEQKRKFNSFFEQIQTRYVALQGLDYMATVRRLGLIAFRIAMILSALRIMETGELNSKITCLDEDFQTSLSLVG
ncbi:MAG TPA: DUF3987 domain-containing protein, partial [Flavobacteriaceae bacterium]|nr:DUF3987 domain-containing protein [Flavobacteriaceae bacterium]